MLYISIHNAIQLCAIDLLVCLDAQTEGVQYHPPNASWPNPDIVRKMLFDYTIHDPKYDDISAVYCPGYKPFAEGEQLEKHNDINK